MPDALFESVKESTQYTHSKTIIPNLCILVLVQAFGLGINYFLTTCAILLLVKELT